MSLVVVKESPIHGRGLFAACAIDRGVLIGTYEGPYTEEDGTYVLWIYEEDGSERGIEGQNIMRFANHSSQPNAGFQGPDLFAIKPIAAGTEITFHYGPEWAEMEARGGIPDHV